MQLFSLLPFLALAGTHLGAIVLAWFSTNMPWQPWKGLH